MGLWTQISGFQSQLHHQLALWTQARSEPAVPQFPLCDMVWRADLGKVCGERTGPGIKGEMQGPIMRQTWGASDTLLNPRSGTTRTCTHTHALLQARLAPWSCLRCGCQSRASPPLCFCLALPLPREQVVKELQMGKQLLHEDRAPGCGTPLAGSAPGSGSMGSVLGCRRAGLATRDTEGAPPLSSCFLRRSLWVPPHDITASLCAEGKTKPRGLDSAPICTYTGWDFLNDSTC